MRVLLYALYIFRRAIQSIFLVGILLWLCCAISAAKTPVSRKLLTDTADVNALFVQNIDRAITLVDRGLSCYFSGEGSRLKMSRYYNVSSGTRSDEVASVWMFGSSFQAVTAILEGLTVLKRNGYAKRYDRYFDHYRTILKDLFNSAAYYLGTFRLTSYTQTRKWTVYGVNRSDQKGAAAVQGRENVYDDQMWLIRDFLDAYQVTGDSAYLDKAEYLVAYVLDGWDCTIDANGNEAGGITWGPGYVTKHACSNAPLIASLVRLSVLYGRSGEEMTYRYIDKADRKSRRTKTMTKHDYYLMFARKLYDWQKKKLLDPTVGVYADMLGGARDSKVHFQKVRGTLYRKNTPLGDQTGSFISYNSGTMLSAAAHLYAATKEARYLEDARALAAASFRYFAKEGKEVPGYYSYNSSGFNGWFNGVLFRGYVDALSLDKAAGAYVESFQKNLDFGYQHYLMDGLLPRNLLRGWGKSMVIGGMITFTYVAEYAILAQLALKGVVARAEKQG